MRVGSCGVRLALVYLHVAPAECLWPFNAVPPRLLMARPLLDGVDFNETHSQSRVFLRVHVVFLSFSLSFSRSLSSLCFSGFFGGITDYTLPDKHIGSFTTPRASEGPTMSVHVEPAPIESAPQRLEFQPRT